MDSQTITIYHGIRDAIEAPLREEIDRLRADKAMLLEALTAVGEAIEENDLPGASRMVSVAIAPTTEEQSNADILSDIAVRTRAEEKK